MYASPYRVNACNGFVIKNRSKVTTVVINTKGVHSRQLVPFSEPLYPLLVRRRDRQLDNYVTKQNVIIVKHERNGIRVDY
jgi:hypothetical protein